MIEEEKNNLKYINLAYILKVFFNHRWILIVLPLLGLIAAVITASIMPKSYVSSSLIQVKNQSMIDPLISQMAVTPDLNAEIQTLTKRILAWPMLEKLVTELGLTQYLKSQIEMRQYIKRLRKNIHIKIKGKDLISINYYSENPKLSQNVVNTIAQYLINENLQAKKKEAQNAIDFIGEQLKIYRKKLESSQLEFSTSKIDSELRLLVNQKRLLEDRISNLPRLIPTQLTKEINPLLNALNAQLSQKISELTRLKIDAKESNPKVLELKKDIASLREQIKEEQKKESIQESVSVLNPSYLQTDEELKKVEMDIEYLNKQKNEIEKSGKNKSKKILNKELTTLEHNKRVDESIYTTLLQQMQNAYVTERLQAYEKGGRFAILEYARMPLFPAKPNKLLIILGGFLSSLAFAIGIIIILELFNKSFFSILEAKDLLEKPIVGTISKIEHNRDKVKTVFGALKRRLQKTKFMIRLGLTEPYALQTNPLHGVSPYVIFINDPQSQLAEEFRIVRSNLLKNEKAEENSSILVTSTLTGEGKSILSTNLAVSLAMTGRKVLLVECNSRNRTISQFFNISSTVGYSDILQNQSTLDRTVKATTIPYLHILSPGTITHNHAEIISSKRAEIFFSDLKNHYETVIFDSVAATNFAETFIMGRYADKILIAVEMERTPKNEVMNTYNALATLQTEITGFVLTNVRYSSSRLEEKYK